LIPNKGLLAQNKKITDLTGFNLGISKFEATQQILSDPYFDNDINDSKRSIGINTIEKKDTSIIKTYTTFRCKREVLNFFDFASGEYILYFKNNELKRIRIESSISKDKYKQFYSKFKDIIKRLKSNFSDYEKYSVLSVLSQYQDYYKGETNGEEYIFTDSQVKLELSYILEYKIKTTFKPFKQKPTHNIDKIEMVISCYNRYWYKQ